MSRKIVAAPVTLGRDKKIHKRRVSLLANLTTSPLPPRRFGASSHSHHVADLLYFSRNGYVAIVQDFNAYSLSLRVPRTYKLTTKGLKLKKAMGL